VSGRQQRVPQRDSIESPFSAILTALADRIEGFHAAVFFDDEGETVDYHSFLEPFQTRLVAAHNGIVISSADARFRWLGLGGVDRLDVRAGWRDSITVAVGGGYFLTVVLEAGAADDEVDEPIAEAVAALKREAGL
jgi:predicted regulator of Ras-like GTPase activity (Roadblock/LC7/MglB family)